MVVAAPVAFPGATVAIRFPSCFRASFLMAFQIVRRVASEVLVIPLSLRARGLCGSRSEAFGEAVCIGGAGRFRFLRQILFPPVLVGFVAASAFPFLSTRTTSCP